MAMNRRSVWVLSALALIFACSAGPGATPTAAPASKPGAAPPKESPMVEVFEAEQLQEFLEADGYIALGRVQKEEPSNQSTRGARVRVLVEVEKPLRGALPRQVGFMMWGAPGTVKQGQQILFACRPPVPQSTDVVLLAFLNVPEGKGEEAARAQQEALEKAGAAK